MAQRSARSPVLILSVRGACPLGSDSTVSALQTGPHGVSTANPGWRAPRCPRCQPAHDQPATTRAQPEAFLALPGEVSRRGRSLQWGDFQKSSPHCAGRSFERPL